MRPHVAESTTAEPQHHAAATRVNRSTSSHRDDSSSSAATLHRAWLCCDHPVSSTVYGRLTGGDAKWREDVTVGSRDCHDAASREVRKQSTAATWCCSGQVGVGCKKRGEGRTLPRGT